MGRPREHDEATREALRAAAERLFDEHGAEGVSVRAIADEVGTTTRAVYTLFGSLDGLVVDALAARAYEILTAALDDHPETDDPAADLADMGPSVFRRFVKEHPALFKIAFQRAVVNFEPGPELTATRTTSVERLRAKVRRLADAGLLGDKTVEQATVEFQAMCEGLGNLEMRGVALPMLPGGDEESAWREAFATFVRGLTASSAKRKRTAARTS